MSEGIIPKMELEAKAKLAGKTYGSDQILKGKYVKKLC